MKGKISVGNHKLMIEIRYDQIPRDNRLCPVCGSNQIEDKIHFLFDCPKYLILKDRFHKKTEYYLPILNNYLI